MPFDATPTTPILDRTAFRQWLATKDNTLCGTRDSTTDCPIANYMYEIYHLKYKVSMNCMNLSSWLGVKITLPLWAPQFIEKVDHGKLYSKIRASTALKILDSIPN